MIVRIMLLGNLLCVLFSSCQTDTCSNSGVSKTMYNKIEQIRKYEENKNQIFEFHFQKISNDSVLSLINLIDAKYIELTSFFDNINQQENLKPSFCIESDNKLITFQSFCIEALGSDYATNMEGILLRKIPNQNTSKLCENDILMYIELNKYYIARFKFETYSFIYSEYYNSGTLEMLTS